MDLFVTRKLDGLYPCDNEDYDKLRKLPMGKAIKVTANTHRNYQFHKKFFKLINTAWEICGEDMQSKFANVDNFRKSALIISGIVDNVYNPRTNEFLQQAKSLKFEKMDNVQFTEVYENVRETLFDLFFAEQCSKDEFYKLVEIYYWCDSLAKLIIEC